MPTDAHKVQRILTVPEHLDNYRPYFVTGNLFVSLPLVSPTDASVERVNTLHMGARGLVEFAGEGENDGTPFIRPWSRVDGRPVEFEGRLDWTRDHYWLPRFILHHRAVEGDLEFHGGPFAPIGHKGFVYQLGAVNGLDHPVTVDLGLTGAWAAALQTIYSTRTVHARRHVYYNPWSRGPIFEVRPATSLVALAMTASESLDYCGWRPSGTVRGDTMTSPSSRAMLDAGNGLGDARDEAVVTGDERVEWVVGKRVQLAPGARIELAFYWACNQDPDGARTTAIDLARRGWQSLLDETKAWLAGREYHVPQTMSGAARLDQLLNQNLLFNYFFAQGYTIDTEELVLVTSRSPRYYVSAAFWARDALIWSFPALLLVDRNHARDALELAFTRYMRNAGIHSLYIDGTVLYPGFELDELVAYVLALDHYVQQSGDNGVLLENWVRAGVDRVVTILRAKRHPSLALYETFLYPSDDPLDQAYVTYDNVVAWKALTIIAGLYKGWAQPDLSRWAQNEAQALAQAVWDHCVVDGPLGPMFAWCVDPDTGDYTIYDEPPGSLRMLPYYGFCAEDDAVYLNTVRWIFSEHNPHYYPDARFNEVGCPHTDEPFVMGLFNALLNGQVDHALAILREVELDAGLACEGFDRETGVVRTGAAFATCGGFLAYAMWRALVAAERDD